MLLKCTQSEKSSKIYGNLRHRCTGNMKLISGTALNVRSPRKTGKGFASKRPSSYLRSMPVTGREDHRSSIDASDNSNDSGLGFDQHLDVSSTVQTVLSERECEWDNEHPETKRKKLEIKLESDDANDNFSFSHAMSKSHNITSQPGSLVPECLMPSRSSASGMQRPLGSTTGNGTGSGGSGGMSSTSRGSLARLPPRPMSVAARRPPGPVSLSSPLIGQSRDGRVQLQIASQPEQQHRARYQTEGSRGAVKDRSGNGFPIVKLVGYNKPTTLQVFIGTDMGRVAPHMFYQACKVSGKNSTPCVEKKIDGTIVIEVDFDPAKDMTITCDCVGILKERNVDVEHRFPDQSGTRNKKKSTRCRMVFRTTITHPDESSEILQTTSQPIVCTQPPGVPEICKKSLSAASCTGGMELFILGKNFLKDTRIVFQQNDIDPAWEETVKPDKEFLQQTHLVCIVPAYHQCDILEPVTVRLLVTSSGKTSEPHSFTYMPATNPELQPAVGSSDIPQSCLNLVSAGVSQGCVDLNRVFSKPPLGSPPGPILPGVPAKPPAALLSGLSNQFLSVNPISSYVKKDVQARLWASVPLMGDPPKTEDLKVRDNEPNKVLGLKMMPPPPLLPIARGASSNVLIVPDVDPVISTELKTEILDESSQESTQLSPEELKGIDLRMKPPESVAPIATVSDLLSTQSPSLATFRQFVSNPSDSPLPTQSGQSVEKYLSHIENPVTPKIGNGGSDGRSGCNGSSSTAIVAGAVTAMPASTSASLSTSDSSPQKIGKMCAPETKDPQFSAAVMFSSSQSTNSSVLTPNLSSSVSEPQKISFDHEMSTVAAMSYSSTSVEEKEPQKPQLAGQTTLQNTMATTLLAAGLNTVDPAFQAKAKYQEGSLSELCSTQPLSSALLPSVNGTALPDFSTTVSTSTEQSPLNVPILLGTANSSGIMETGASLLFNGSQQLGSKSMLPSTDVSQKSDEQLISNTNKMSHLSSSSSSSSSSPSSGILSVSHNLLQSSVAPIENTSLNISAPSGTAGGNLLTATQSESALMTATSSSRLEALMSSTIKSHILEANCQTQTSEKLNSFPPPNMSVVSTDSGVLVSQAQVSDGLRTNQNTSSPIHGQEITLNSALSVSSGNSFPLNSMSSVQPSPQIAQKNLILNDTVRAAFSTHRLRANSTVKGENASLALNPVSESSMTLEAIASGGTSSHIVMSNSNCASPIAMKSIIMNTANLIGETNTLNSNESPNSQISGKSIVNTSTIRNVAERMSNANHTPPIALKAMLLTEPVDKPSMMTSPLDVKDILVPADMKEEVALSSASSHSSSSIAMKKIILESTPVVNTVLPNSTLEVKPMINSQSPESLLTATISLSTEKFDSLVESTVNNHILSSSLVPTTNSMNIESTVCVPRNSVPLTTQSLATIIDSNMQTSLSNSTLGCPCRSLQPESESRELHNSATINSLENPNVSLPSAQERAPAILSSQSQSVTGSSLMTIFSPENETVGRERMESAPAVSTTSLLNHHLNMFGQQTAASVHELTSNQSCTDAQALSHSVPFSSTNSNISGIIPGSSCTLPTNIVNGIPITPQGEETQTRLLNEALMVLTTGNRGKNQIDMAVSQDNKKNEVKNPKYEVTNVDSKITESRSIISCSPSVTKLDSQVVHLQQQPQEVLQIAQQQSNISDQGKQRHHKEQVVSNASLSLPVADISSAKQTTKDAVQGPIQKKLEEGMVPQELTQMSESDLLSYINPSCFDQV